jgi:hypothetical protein
MNNDGMIDRGMYAPCSFTRYIGLRLQGLSEMKIRLDGGNTVSPGLNSGMIQ